MNTSENNLQKLKTEAGRRKKVSEPAGRGSKGNNEVRDQLILLKI